MVKKDTKYVSDIIKVFRANADINSNSIKVPSIYRKTMPTDGKFEKQTSE
jgi:hypothetical protein